MARKKTSLSFSENGGKYVRECDYCGKKFTATHVGERYCSAKCKKARAQSRKRDIECECACCGKRFIVPVTRSGLYCPAHVKKSGREKYYREQYEAREKAWIEHSKENRRKKQESAVKILRPGIDVMYEGRKATVVDPLVPSLNFSGAIRPVERRKIVIL